MRIGQGDSYLDNAHAGGMFIAISDDGKLSRKAFTEFRKEFEIHPDTGLIFEGHTVEGVSKVPDAARRLHELIPQIGVINWDFTVDEHCEIVLIEASTERGSLWLFEEAHGKGAFGDDTAAILEWIALHRKESGEKRKKCIMESRLRIL